MSNQIYSISHITIKCRLCLELLNSGIKSFHRDIYYGYKFAIALWIYICHEVKQIKHGAYSWGGVCG